jgi:spermidine/putrescine transport system ATP-binding protein
VLYVTHDQEEALVMSDRIAVIRDGSAVQVGTGDELYARPQSPFVAGFIGESNLFRGRLGRDGDRYLLSSNGWSMEVPPSSLAGGLGKAGGDAVVVVRPEHLGIGTATGPGSAHHDGLVQLSARFTGATRLGATYRYDLELVDGQTVRASLPAGTEHPAVRPGDDVTIHWRPVDCVVLPADERGGTP